MSEEKDGKWEMPQPVFKSSEGSLPKSLEETISTSFMANAETIEIDEDDDILGIMDTLPGDYSLPSMDHEDDILETALASDPEPARILETSPAAEIPAETPIPDTDEPQPISVTAKETAETTESVVSESGSGFFVYVLLLLIAVALGVLYYYFVQKK